MGGVNSALPPTALVAGPPVVITTELSLGSNPVPADVLIHNVDEGVDLALPSTALAAEPTMVVPFHDAVRGALALDFRLPREAPQGLVLERLENTTFLSRGLNHASRRRQWL